MTAGRLCVIGDPVGHSLSPLLHRAMIAQTGVPYTYELHPMSAAALPEFVAAAKDGAWAGCNVTMPHKQTILRCAARWRERARPIFSSPPAARRRRERCPP